MECECESACKVQTAQQNEQAELLPLCTVVLCSSGTSPRATRNDSLLVVQDGFYEAYCLQMHG